MSSTGSKTMRVEERIMRFFALFAGYLLLAQAVVTAVEIIARKVFNHSFQGVDELGGYVLAIAASFGFGYAVVTRAHTRIDLVLSRLPLSIRAVLHQLASVTLLVVASGMFWYGLRSLRQSINYQSISTTPLQTPLWIPQGIWLLGLALFVVMSLLVCFRSIKLLSKRNFGAVEHEMKAMSQEQQELEMAGFTSKKKREN